MIGVSAASSQEKAREAWWLTATFVAEHTSYRSLRASEIDSEWVRISPLTFAGLPKDAADDLEWMKRDRFQFSWDGDLNKNGLADHIATGVYESRDGSTGRFLLVLERAASGHWQRKFVHKEPGPPGFSVLRITKSGIFWNTCMLCGDFRRLIPSKNSFRLT